MEKLHIITVSCTLKHIIFTFTLSSPLYGAKAHSNNEKIKYNSNNNGNYRSAYCSNTYTGARQKSQQLCKKADVIWNARAEQTEAISCQNEQNNNSQSGGKKMRGRIV